MRSLIALQLGEPRPSREEIEERLRQARPQAEEQPVAFLPGGQDPSW